MPEITVGRDTKDIAAFGERKGTGFIGNHIVGERKDAHYGNPVNLDLARPHVMGVVGKRGSGKSYTLGVLAEEIQACSEIQDNVATIMIDTMGIFWSMKYPNDSDASLLAQWDLQPGPVNADIYIPTGMEKEFTDRNVPFDKTFALHPADLTVSDWLLAFEFDRTSEEGVLLERAVSTLQDDHDTYTVQDIINHVETFTSFPETVRNALVNRFEAAQSWGLFSSEATRLEEMITPGSLTVIDVSLYGELSEGWSVRTLIVGLLARKILRMRMEAKRVEELEEMEGITKSERPIVWMLIDEAHMFVPEDGSTAATTPLLQWAKIGREPGVSLVLATQQPNKLNADILSQTDLLLSHRLTARDDISALKNIMQTYMRYDLTDYIDGLPRRKGTAIVLDDNSERVYSVQVRPRKSWHAGGTPTALKT